MLNLISDSCSSTDLLDSLAAICHRELARLEVISQVDEYVGDLVDRLADVVGELSVLLQQVEAADTVDGIDGLRIKAWLSGYRGDEERLQDEWKRKDD